MSVAITSPAAHSDDAPVPTVTPTPRTWLRQIVGGGQIIETCAKFCTQSHATDRRGMLDDLMHVGDETAMTVTTFDHWHDGVAVSSPAPVLSASIRVDPYSENPRRRIPHVLFELSAADLMEGLGPDEFAAAIAQIRSHCDRLDGVLAQLVQARAEYADVAITA